MRSITAPQFAPEIVALRTRFEAWRRTKKGGEPIPGGLWDAAVELAADHGVYSVSCGLNLDYSKLKRLVAEAEHRRSEVPVEFVELPEFFGTPGRPAVIEMRRADGASFRVEMPNGVDVLALAATFWGGVG